MLDIFDPFVWRALALALNNAVGDQVWKRVRRDVSEVASTAFGHLGLDAGLDGDGLHETFERRCRHPVTAPYHGLDLFPPIAEIPTEQSHRLASKTERRGQWVVPLERGCEVDCPGVQVEVFNVEGDQLTGAEAALDSCVTAVYFCPADTLGTARRDTHRADNKRDVRYNALTHLLVDTSERSVASSEGRLTDREGWAAWRQARDCGDLKLGDDLNRALNPESDIPFSASIP